MTRSWALMVSLSWLCIPILSSCAALPVVPSPSLSPNSQQSQSTAQPPPSWLQTLQANQPLQLTPSNPPTNASPLSIRRCLGTQVGSPPGAFGSLVLWDDSGVYMQDLRTGRRTSVVAEDDGFIDASLYTQLVSPDLMHFAFVEWFTNTTAVNGTRSLRVIDASGHDVTPRHWEQEWSNTGGWITPSTVAIVLRGDPKGTMVAYDPFTGDAVSLPPVFPDMNVHDPIHWYKGGPLAVYDASLTRAVYFAYDSRFVMWGIPEGEPIWTASTDDARTPPIWSPDGTKVAVVLASHSWAAQTLQESSSLYVVTAAGDATKIVDTRANFSPEAAGILNPRWSPDGTTIAFQLVFGSPSGDIVDLATVDLVSGVATAFCLNDFGLFAPFWSPDGRYIAGSDGLLVDTVSAIAYRIAPGSVPMGWLAPSKQ